MPQLYILAVPNTAAHVVAQNAGGTPVGNVRTIGIDFTHGSLPIDDALNADWEQFTSNACGLPSLDTVMFGFLTLEDVDRFVRLVVSTKMERLRDRDRVRYLVMGKVGTWMYASPGSKQLRGKFS